MPDSPISTYTSTAGGMPTYPSLGITSTNPYTLSGTQVTEITTNAIALSARVHRQAIEQYNWIELWYLRDGTWSLLPSQPLTSDKNQIVINQVYKQPATMDFSIMDQFGYMMADNLESPYNYNAAGSFDPLIDEARKIVLRVGSQCYGNLASGLTPTFNKTPYTGSGAATKLTDGSLHDPASMSLANLVGFSMVGGELLRVDFDLSTSQRVRHAVVRFLQKTGIINNSRLPFTITMYGSVNGSTYFPLKETRPVSDDDGAGTYGPGDWANSNDGIAVECAFCDLDRSMRYVRFEIIAAGTGTVLLDEVAIYGGTTAALYGRNMFTGYLGDTIDAGNDGTITLSATDVSKKAADNNECRLTAYYTFTDTSDIIISLLTSSAYWKSQSDYSSPFGASEIGWTTGSALTGLVYPQYQSQTNSILGYIQELAYSIGWNLYTDSDGIWQKFEPPFRQRQPTRLFIAAGDGNNDVRNCRRKRSGKNLRNTVEVTTGKLFSGGAGSLTQFEPNSVAKYGPRRVVITDPILNDTSLRKKVSDYVLRDYAWRLQRLECNIQPDYYTMPKDIHAFRAPARPNLYARKSAYKGNRRLGQMWSLEQLTHNISTGDWNADAVYNPYVPFTIGSPEFDSLTPGDTTPDPILSMRAAWNAVTDATAAYVRLYVSATSETSGFTLVSTVASTSVDALLTTYDGVNPVVLGNRYWVYLTTVDIDGVESLPSVVLSCVIGSVAEYSSCWTVTDLGVTLVTASGPDADGYYSYQFQATWTSPSCGFKRMQIYLNPLVQPSPAGDPTAILKESWAFTNDWYEWHGDYIGPGLMWDRVTPGTLDWTIVFRTTTALGVGDKMYFRMFTSSATTRWRKWGGDSDWEGWASNVTFYTF